MDPNANLERQLEIVERLRAIGATPAPAGQSNVALEIECCQLAWELAELVSDLSEWIAKGGFLPDAWKVEPTCPTCGEKLELKGYGGQCPNGHITEGV